MLNANPYVCPLVVAGIIFLAALLDGLRTVLVERPELRTIRPDDPTAQGRRPHIRLDRLYDEPINGRGSGMTVCASTSLGIRTANGEARENGT